jgi:hypothetical protein
METARDAADLQAQIDIIYEAVTGVHPDEFESE